MEGRYTPSATCDGRGLKGLERIQGRTGNHEEMGPGVKSNAVYFVSVWGAYLFFETPPKGPIIKVIYYRLLRKI